MDYDTTHFKFAFLSVKTPQLHSSHSEVLKKNFQLSILKLLNTDLYFETLQYNTKWNLANTVREWKVKEQARRSSGPPLTFNLV
jgi:hypothetical protein